MDTGSIVLIRQRLSRKGLRLGPGQRGSTLLWRATPNTTNRPPEAGRAAICIPAAPEKGERRNVDVEAREPVHGSHG